MKNNTKQKGIRSEQKHVEAVARRNWASVTNGMKYKKASVNETCKRISSMIKEQLFDGIFLELNTRNADKSYSVQKRILRRVVEKRQAQQVHKKFGRTPNRLYSHLFNCCQRRCLEDLCRYQYCA